MKALNKVRNMKGIRPGRGSAGRATSTSCGLRQPKADRFLDVLTNCKEFLMIRQCLTPYEIYQQDSEYR